MEKDTIVKQRKSNGLLEILKKIPEGVMDVKYDTIINDLTFGHVSESMEPRDFENDIMKMFPEFRKPLFDHIQKLFDELNILPEDGICKACEIEKRVRNGEDVCDLTKLCLLSGEDDTCDISNVIGFYEEEFQILPHEIEGNLNKVYYLNLLESNIDEKIKEWAISVTSSSLSSYHGLLRHREAFHNSNFLQYLSYRLIEIAKTVHLAKYAIYMWKRLLMGEFLGIEVGYSEGPDLILEFAEKAKESLLKKDKIFSSLIEIIDSEILNYKNRVY
ncbi:MAG: hypothetical protein HZR80_00905 [Candidatus Heimdallarchaeota archaeon]